MQLILKTFEAHRKKPITSQSIDINFYEEFKQDVSEIVYTLLKSQQIHEQIDQNCWRRKRRNVVALIIYALKNQFAVEEKQ